MSKYLLRICLATTAIFFDGFSLMAAKQNPSSQMPPSAASKSLLGTRWDFSDGALADWRHKDNARIEIADVEGSRALRLRSSFRPFNFTWVTRDFTPQTLDGVARIRLRIRADGTGHTLQLHLGTRAPSGDRWLYYVNSRQAVKLDFTGWKTVSFDIDQFYTPQGGRRDRDFAQIQFLELTITARHPAPPTDLRFDDIEFVDRTPEESAQIERQRQERQKMAAELSAAMEPVRRRLVELRQELDKRANEGKPVEVARVYSAALDWCARDVERSLRSEEYDVVSGVKPRLESLEQWLAQPNRVFARVGQTASAGQCEAVAASRFAETVLKSVRAQVKSERSWPKGRAGYQAVNDPWEFRRFGEETFTSVWALTRPASPMRHDPALLANVLGLFDLIAHQHTDGDFNADRTAPTGRDPNINRFCLAPTLDAWCELRQAYPDLLPPAWQTDLERGFKRLADRQIEEYGLGRLADRPDLKAPAYPNMDVHYILIMELAHRLWKEPRYRDEREGFLKLVESAVYPGGAIAYVNRQNDCFIYHHLTVVYLARLWKLTGELRVLELLRRTIPYYPHNIEPAGMPEYYTDPSWKHYWGRGDMAGPATIASLFNDPMNQRVYETCAAVWGHERGYVGAIAADFFKPLPSKPLPDNYLIFDENIQGPRGRYGDWSFAANGRNYGEGFQGKDTFVGCMVTDPARRPLPLDAALQVVTTEVRLNHIENHWSGGRCLSARERLSAIVGPDFASLGVRYMVSHPQWHFQNDELLPWEGTQTWYLSPTRLVGLVSLEATADETRSAVLGRIRLGVKRELVSLAPNAWKYGRLNVRIHGHNYAKIVARPSETTLQDKPSGYRSTELTLIDPQSVAAGERGEVLYRKGAQYWFLVEVFRDAPSIALAEQVERIEQSPLVGFRFNESDRQVVVLHNPTARAAVAEIPRFASGMQLSIYREKRDSAVAGVPQSKIQLEPHQHCVIVGRRSGVR